MNMTMYVLLNADVIGPSIHSMASFDSYLPNSRSDNAAGYLGKFSGFTVGGTYSTGRDAAGPAGPSATNCAGKCAGDPVACRQYTMMLAYDSAQFGVGRIVRRDARRHRRVGAADEPAATPTRTISSTGTPNSVRQDRWRLDSAIRRRRRTPVRHLFSRGYVLCDPGVIIRCSGVRNLQRETSNSTLLVGRVNYLLSKRTMVYTSVGYMMNSSRGTARLRRVERSAPAQNQLGVMVGIQQRF